MKQGAVDTQRTTRRCIPEDGTLQFFTCSSKLFIYIIQYLLHNNLKNIWLCEGTTVLHRHLNRTQCIKCSHYDAATQGSRQTELISIPLSLFINSTVQA
jgi:hypothetical protein